MKKLCVLLAVLMLISCFAGCTPAENPDSNESTQSSGSDQQQESTGASSTDSQESTGTSSTDSQESTGSSDEDVTDDDIPEGVLAISGKGVNVRQLAVDYMLKMANLKWTAGTTIDYSGHSPSLVYEEGKTYVGMVYNNNQTGLEKFCSFLDSDNVNTSKDTNWSTSVGNSCSTSIRHAWQLISPSVNYVTCINMIPGYQDTGVVAVGDIDWSAYNGDDTNKVLKSHDRKVIMEAYAQAHAGDALVRFLPSGGHALMITKEPEVHRNSDGSVNIIKSCLYLTDQNSRIHNRREYPSSWEVDRRVSFSEAYQEGYLPVTCAELVSGVAPNATFELANEPTAEELAQGFLLCTVTSNYCMNVVKLEILSGEEVVATASAYPYARSLECYKLGEDAGLKDLAAGNYTLKLTAEVGIGSITLANVTFSK